MMQITNGIQVVIVDDHPIYRYGLRKLLENAPGFHVVGEGENGEEAIELVKQLAPDVLILDIQMPVMDGIQVLEELRKMNSPVKTIILSAFNNKFFAYETITKGASGYLIKEETPYQLLDAIRDCAIEKRIFISQAISI